MAATKLLAVAVAVLLIAIAGIRADSGVDFEASEAVEGAHEPVAPLKLEIERLRSQIAALESSMSEKTNEVKGKSESIAKVEKILEEKSSIIASLQSEIELLQKKGALDAEELVGKAHARAHDLEKQVNKLKGEIETQTKLNDALEGRASDTEKKLQELKLKFENLQKMNAELKNRLQKTEHALKVAEEDLMRAQLEATSKSKELTEIHGAWVPHWLAIRIGLCQDIVATHWNDHGKPALNVLLQKASEKSAKAQKWVEPHLEVAKTKWVPAAKEQWMVIATQVEPFVQKVSTKTIEMYEVSKDTIGPHITKAQELVDPYIQQARKRSKPYFEQIATISRPHVEKVRLVLDPYTRRAVYTYGEFLKSATTYHHQAQAAINKKLQNHELTKHLATKELVWFMASAVLALPILFMFKLFSIIFCKKTRKPVANTHRNHTSRRPKRRHADK